MDNKAEQYYPTYTFKPENRDIVLLEFEEAQKIANSQTKVYGQVANILLAVVTILIPLFFKQDNNLTNHIFGIIQSNSVTFSLVLIAFSSILLRYFVELQRQITINARKAVTLRTLLGLDYGTMHLTLPNWRVEGATNPFAIKYFNGWFRFQSFPFWVLSIGMNVIWWLATNDRNPIIIPNSIIKFEWVYGNIALTVWFIFIFRHNLNDLYETTFLHLVKVLAFVLRIKLVDNFEYIIYRMKLSYIELERLKVDYSNLKKVLIDIEDITFYDKSVSFKSLIRGFLSQWSFFRKKYKLLRSGGSTIAMQLVRSAFIPDLAMKNRWFRKIIEILLAFWITGNFSKEEILKLYISSVRYEKGILGLANAIKHFIGEIKDKKLSNEECFFLVERLSNSSSTINNERIEHLLTRTSILIDKNKLYELYNSLKRQGKLK